MADRAGTHKTIRRGRQGAFSLPAGTTLLTVENRLSGYSQFRAQVVIRGEEVRVILTWPGEPPANLDIPGEIPEDS